ncbi:hypothetical protein ACJD0Z_09480 [Flavobacteriaceae bacterium M23B6Z8]
MKKQEKYNSEITKEDLQTLGGANKGLRQDGGEDEMLKEREEKVDFAGADLDVPGRKDLPSSNKPINDEENTLFGQGGDSKESLEQTDEHIKP